jgi:poly(A) polymerase
MLVRYNIQKTQDGSEIKRGAHVYTLEEHGIDRSRIDSDAVRVIQRLRRGGFQGYVVGGAVRDLLVGISPKDFDIATNAHPGAVRKLFRSSRVIGRRFKLVHVYCGHEKYLEVATFRAGGGDEENANAYGTIAEDALRRDFTLNALFYDPLKEQIVDYVGGVKDVRAKRMRSISPDDVSFVEDPVRIIRGVKHAAIVGFKIPFGMKRAIRKHRHRLRECSAQRVTEELYKILRCGRSEAVLRDAFRLGVIEPIMPELHRSLSASKQKEKDLWERLAQIDALPYKQRAEGVPTGRLLCALLRDAIVVEPGSHAVAEALRAAAAPLVPSNNDLRVAAAFVSGRARGATARP